MNTTAENLHNIALDREYMQGVKDARARFAAGLELLDSPLSGEWADGVTPLTIEGRNAESLLLHDSEDRDVFLSELSDAYENGYFDAERAIPREWTDEQVFAHLNKDRDTPTDWA